MKGLLARVRARFGGPQDAPRALALRARGAASEVGDIVAALEDPSPGVRRAGAWVAGERVRAGGALARGADARLVAALDAAARRERTAEGALALALARAAGGANMGALQTELAAREALTFLVDGAALRPLAAWPRDLVGRLDRVVAGQASARAADEPATDRERVLLRALPQQPADHDEFARLARDPGRRGSHLGLQALGLHGDPRGAPLLRAALHAMDVDPGRGFAQRRLAALGLGRLGVREATPWLLTALAAEAHDHEGRPGAGLGVQFPVRGEILLALGELGDPRAIPALVAHLADPTHHLAAMGALHALGDLAHPALDEIIARSAGGVAARARAVREA